MLSFRTPEFVADALREWLKNTVAKTLYSEPGLPWENGYCESFNSKLRDEFLNGKNVYSIKELRVHYNTVIPHLSQWAKIASSFGRYWQASDTAAVFACHITRFTPEILKQL